MNTLESTFGTPVGYALLAASMLLVAGQLASLIEALRTHRGARQVLPHGLHFLAGLSLLVVLHTLYAPFASSSLAPEFPATFQTRAPALLWGAFAGAEVLSFLLLGLGFRSALRYRRTHLTPDAIREAVDRLPAGICVSGSDGTVLLANLRMNDLCRSLTGGPLTDGQRFWQGICIRGTPRGDGILALTPEREAWLFARTQLVLNGLVCNQIIATELTAQYRVTETLTQRNQALREVQYRMKAVAARERSLVAARETMNARVTVHNQLGNVLLTGKYYLDHPQNMDEAELKRLLEYSGGFLLGEAEQPQAAPDPLDESLRAARRIGVTVALTGDLPQEGFARDLLAQAIAQCAANAVRHAGGNRLTVALTHRACGLCIDIGNNGDPPAGPVRETGGLAALRKMAESGGGGMAVESLPAFHLTLTLPDCPRRRHPPPCGDGRGKSSSHSPRLGG